MKKTLSRFVVSGLLGGALCLSLPAEAEGPFQFFTLAPCRLVDTRDADGPTGGPILQDQGVRKFPIQGGSCGVPVGAKAATLNVTAVLPTGQGHLRLFPSDISVPQVSTVNFAAGEKALANGAIVPLADQSVALLDLSVFSRIAGSGSVHVVIDVTGYFQ